ncbi:MAG: ribokinase, partial [Mesorhizobium sp.]
RHGGSSAPTDQEIQTFLGHYDRLTTVHGRKQEAHF